MEILGKLGINGKILLAQVVNFFLLMYLLKRFLYQPLLTIMKNREKKIKEGLDNARKAEKRIAEVEEKVKAQLEKTSREADRILAKAHTEGEEQKEDLVREAKEEIIKWKEETKSLLKKEKERIITEIREETGEIAIAIAGKIIKEKISAQDKQKLLSEIKEEANKAV